MRNYIIILLLILLQSLNNYLFSQDSELKITKESEVVVIDTSYHHSPKKATWLSAAIPGAGQFYNKSYWKIPVIYIAGGAMIYTTIANRKSYHEYKNAYNHLYENPDDPKNPDDTSNRLEGFEAYNLEQLKSIKDDYRYYRDLSIIGLFILYTLNIVDATVDGYFYDYDVSDNLSLHIEPQISTPYFNQKNNLKASNQFGFKMVLNF